MAVTTKPKIYTHVLDTTRPCAQTIEITPNDDNYLADAGDSPLVTRAIWVEGAGTIKVEFAQDPAGTYRTFTVAVGVVYPFAVVKVHTDSTATGIIGLL